jgi:predicted dehydrogenase/nucleoside-diphosphate-sugar epimerase
MPDLRVAIIGCGAITEHAYLPAVKGLDGVRITGLVDKNCARAKTLAAVHGIPQAAENVAELPELPEAAIVALPHYLHAPISIELLQRGIHVLVEKPMAVSTAQCDAMIRAAVNTDTRLAAGLVRRFLPEVRLAKEVIDSGRLGSIQSFDVQEGRIYDWPSTTDAPLRRDMAGGGVLIDLGVHVLDTLLYCLGDSTVLEYSDDSYGGVEAETEMSLRLASGASGHVALSRTRDLRNTMLIRGAKATLEVDLYLRKVALHVGTEVIGLTAKPDAWGGDVFRAQLADWVGAIHTGVQPAVPGPEGRRSVALIEACYARRKKLALPWVVMPHTFVGRTPASAAGPLAGPSDWLKPEQAGRGRPARVRGPAPPILYTSGKSMRHFPWVARLASPNGRKHNAEKLRGHRVLVTGGTGFIGGRLIEKLVLEQGAEVRVLVRDFARASRIARFNIEMVHGDVIDTEAVRSAVRGCDVVFHCAYGNRGTEEEQRAVNVDGAEIVAREVLRAGIPRLVHVSTMAVYGQPSHGDVDETTAYMGPGDAYTQTKRQAERMIVEMSRREGLPAVVLQPTCVYGPYGLAFTIDPLRELRTRKVVLVNGGEGLYNGVYIDDVVNALLLAATEAAAVGEVFLISGDAPVSFREFYGAYERMLGRSSTISMMPDEVRAYSTDGRPEPFRIHSEHMLGFYTAKAKFRIDKARKLLGYQPEFDFEKGMQLTEQWARWAGLIPGVNGQ